MPLCQTYFKTLTIVNDIKFSAQLFVFLVSSIGRARAWWSEGPGFESRSELKFFFGPSDFCFYQIILIKELVLNVTLNFFSFFSLTRGQILIFTKNALSPLCYILYQCNSYISISLRASITLMGSKVILGFPRAGYAVCDGSNSSSSFFFFFLPWQHVFFTYFPTSDFALGVTVPWPLLRHKQWWGQRSRWGQ